MKRRHGYIMIKKYTYPVSLAISLITLAIVSSLFIKQYLSIRGNGALRVYHDHKPRLRTENIQVWMTFEYINRSFNLPEGFLKNELSILDSSYPKITISKFSNLSGKNEGEVLRSVKTKIEEFKAAQGPASK